MYDNDEGFADPLDMLEDDNGDLGSVCVGGGFRMGHVDEVNGEGATQVASFTPTKYELIQLATHWARVAIDTEYFWFCYQQYGSDDTRRREFAWRRISRISKSIGEEAVNGAVKAAYAELEKQYDSRTWRVFLNGTDEERRAVQEEIEREMKSVEHDMEDGAVRSQ